MAHSIRHSLTFAALAACLTAGMAAHAAGDSVADKLKSQANTLQKPAVPVVSPSPAPAIQAPSSVGNPLQKLTDQKSTGAAASGSSAGGALLGGALGGSVASGALGGSALSGLGLPNIASGSAGNVAGVLEYCVKNNYLKKANINTLKDGLMSKAGLAKAEPEKDSSYANGLNGILTGGDGKSFNLSGIQDSVKEKACDYVLDNATSLL